MINHNNAVLELQNIKFDIRTYKNRMSYVYPLLYFDRNLLSLLMVCFCSPYFQLLAVSLLTVILRKKYSPLEYEIGYMIDS